MDNQKTVVTDVKEFVEKYFEPRVLKVDGTGGLVIAPQGMNVVVIIVILRSCSFSIVRLAIIPGIPQPVPTSIGIKDFPESPNRRKTLSIINAMRAI